MTKTFKQYKILLLIGFFLCVPFFLAGAQEFVPLTGLPGVPTSGATLPEYLNVIFRIVIGVGALLAVIQITLGGVMYMTSEAIGGKAAGKSKIQAAIVGLLIILATVLILQTINPQILNLDILGGATEATPAPPFTAPGSTDSSLTTLPCGSVRPSATGECSGTYPAGEPRPTEAAYAASCRENGGQPDVDIGSGPGGAVVTYSCTTGASGGAGSEGPLI